MPDADGFSCRCRTPTSIWPSKWSISSRRPAPMRPILSVVKNASGRWAMKTLEDRQNNRSRTEYSMSPIGSITSALQNLPATQLDRSCRPVSENHPCPPMRSNLASPGTQGFGQMLDGHRFDLVGTKQNEAQRYHQTEGLASAIRTQLAPVDRVIAMQEAGVAFGSHGRGAQQARRFLPGTHAHAGVNRP